MLHLQDEFIKHARLPSVIDGATQQTDTQSDADSMDVLTFEYEDNPFTSFMKQLETLMETDPQEALRLVKLAIADDVFERKAQIKKLTEVLDEAIDLVQQERDSDYGFSGALENRPCPQKDFFKTVRNLPAAVPEQETASPPAPAPANMPSYASHGPRAA